MNNSDNGIDLIKRFEGFSAKPYLCPANVPTIGYGSTYYCDGSTVALDDDPLTEQEATKLLKYNIKKFEDAVSKLVTVPITQNEFDALVSFVYNLGPNALKKSTLLRLLNAGDKESAAEQFLRWTKASGRELPGLVKRREAERKLFLT